MVVERTAAGDGRARLLAAGADLLEQRLGQPGGVLRGLTPGEVAQAAGLSRTALYRYWPAGPDGSTGQVAGFQAYLADLGTDLCRRRLDAGQVALGTLGSGDELDEVVDSLAGGALGSGSPRWWLSVVGLSGGGGDWGPVAVELAAVLELVLRRAGYELTEGGTWTELAQGWLVACDGAAVASRTQSDSDMVLRGVLKALVAHWCRPSVGPQAAGAG